MIEYRAWQEGIPDDTKSGGPWFVSVPDGGDIEIGYDANGLPDEYHAKLFAAAEALLKALQLLEKAEEFHANCEECGGEDVPEACAVCFPLFDDARIARRGALALVSTQQGSDK